MFFWLLFFFTVVPLIELALLIEIGGRIGAIPTLALVFLTGTLGAWLARWQGLRALHAVQQEMAAGRVPAGALLDGLLILVGAVLLITPGVLTDAMGLALLIPPVRAVVRTLVRRWAEKHVRVVGFPPPQGPEVSPSRGPVIDAEVIHPPRAPGDAGSGGSAPPEDRGTPA